MLFTTYDNTDFEPNESFEVHVRLVGDSSSEVELEAIIIDKDRPTYSNATIEFIYDYADRLIGQTLDTDAEGPEAPVTTYFAYENGQIVFQFEGNDLTHRNLWGPQVDQLLAAEGGGGVLWPLADQVGSIRDIAEYNSTTNETTVTNHRKYDSFGNLEAESDAAVDLIFGYTGRLFNEATGLQNNHHRWYDARIGQFVSEDPIGFAGNPSNLYRYVENRPTDRIDPSGLQGTARTYCTLTKHYSRGGDDEARTYETARIAVTMIADGHSDAQGCVFNIRLFYKAFLTGRLTNPDQGRYNLIYKGIIVPLRYTPTAGC